MKFVYLALNWIFGVLFLLMGVFDLIESPLGGICRIAIAALLLPPVRSFVYSKTNKELPVKVRAVSIFVLVIAFEVFIDQSQDRKAQKLAAQQAQGKIDYFNANREQIISLVKAALSAEEYQSVFSQSNKYLVVGDKELEQMNAQAKKEVAATQKAKKTEKLLAELKSVPTEEYEKNKNLYQQLMNLHPDNEKYKSKIKFYKTKILEELDILAEETKVLFYKSTIPGPQTSKSYYIKESVKVVRQKNPKIIQVKIYSTVESPEGTTTYRMIQQINCRNQTSTIVAYWSSGFGYDNGLMVDGKWRSVADYDETLALAKKLCHQ